MHTDMILPIGIAIVTATLFAFLAKWLRQPLVLGYMAAGVVIGKTQGMGWVSTHDIESISELGLILLLFMIGLEIDLKKLKQAGKPVIVAGITQFLLCVGLGLLFFPIMGYAWKNGDYSSLYMAVAAALSSTMIVVKLLYDKFELDTLPGRITLGVLVFQDIWAILFLGMQPNLQNPAPLILLGSIGKAVILIAFAMLVSRYLLPMLFKSIAKLPELMMIGALAWCFGIAMLAQALGLSREMGALIAGVAISTFPYNLDVIAKVISLRDFFITLFFVSLGTKIPAPTKQIVLLALGASAFLIASRFLTIFPVLRSLKNGNRASLIPALNLAQISEFSLVIGAIGVGLGHITADVLSTMVMVLVITSVSSTYMILFNHQLFDFLNPVLRRLGIGDLGDHVDEENQLVDKPLVFLGFSHDASSLLHEIMRKNPEYLDLLAVVDFNPEVKHELDHRGITSIYGDISHSDTLHHANIHDAKVLVATIPDSLLKGTSNLRLLRQLRHLAPQSQVIVTAQRLSDAQMLYAAGASYVYVPRIMSVKDLHMIVAAAMAGPLDQQRREAMMELEEREEVLP
jgi:Kef-type K+ transport system membrane component KefB